MGIELKELLEQALECGASDVHVVAGRRPLLRLNRLLEEAQSWPAVSPEEIEQFVKDNAGQRRFEELAEAGDVDFSIQMGQLGRFRVNAHIQRETPGLVFHTIPNRVPLLEELNLPQVVESLIDLPRGLVLVTGQTGDGKSTTLASMIGAMNCRYAHHVITLEDPVEYELTSGTCLIEQREVGRDVASFAAGIRSALRQDPDVIMVGEMRDLETTSAAITAAETGHLVLSTLHTQSAPQTIERIIDIYPSNQQNMIRAVLASTLRAVVCQALFNRSDATGMIPACEVMTITPAVRHCVRESRIQDIPNIIQTSRDEGMLTLQDSITALYLAGRISRRQAMAFVPVPDSLSKVLSA